MSEPAQKRENNPISNQNYAHKLFIAFKTAYSCCFGLRENLDFPDFLQKKFYNIDCRERGLWNANYRTFPKLNINITSTFIGQECYMAIILKYFFLPFFCSERHFLRFSLRSKIRKSVNKKS